MATAVPTSWGGLAATRATLVTPQDWRAGQGALLPFGNGRSYGDTCLNDDGRMILTRRGPATFTLDAATGEVIADAAVLLSDLIVQCLPQGWFVPVTPGTRFVTLGGMLANDVHGKNHHDAGTFGQHVAWFELMRSDGTLLRCAPDENAELFRATIGGMGLTGLVTRLSLRMMKVSGPMIAQEVVPFADLAGFFAEASQADATHPYTVAWIDSLATGRTLGRGVLFKGRHCRSSGEGDRKAGFTPVVPFTPPVPLVNRPFMTVFNAAYRFAHRAPRASEVHCLPFFYPLDGVRHWNRIYGPSGLRQFQCVVPMDRAEASVRRLIEATHQAGAASFLTVLKLFGDKPSPGLLSFPVKGATLTLDFAYRGAQTDRLLAALDRIVLEAGGRVNPYKDARMTDEVFRASFPRWREFAQHVDPGFSSNFWRRVSA
jgi:FAD/FMN-containing dehydrogenase